MEKKSVREIISVIFKAMTLAMDVAVAVLSLPIPVNALMASRLLTVYLMGVTYSIVVILPAVVVYWIVAFASAGAIFDCLLLMLLISVFILTLSCILGWVVAKISLKLKNKSFITVLVSLAFFGGYYFICMKAQTLIQDLLANAAEQKVISVHTTSVQMRHQKYGTFYASRT